LFGRLEQKSTNAILFVVADYQSVQRERSLKGGQ
jgi:hypothetical protein